MRHLLAIIFITLLSVSCGGGGSSSDTAADDTNNDTNTTNDTTDINTGPSIEGFDFVLREGDFWEFGWDGKVSRFAQGSGGSTSEESGRFRLTLGAPSNIGGVSAYEILVSGNPSWGDTRDFTPRWRYIGMDNNKIYGSTDGATLELVFDAETGSWSGGGFFSEWPDDTLIVASQGTIDNAYITDSEAITVGRSSSQDQCETIAGIVICGDQSFTSTEREYFKPGVGLLGYRFFNSFSFSGGGFSSGGSDEYDVGLIASSLRGDSVDYILEVEPNNSFVNAMPLALPANLRGDALIEGDSQNGGWVAIVLNTIDEIEPNDSSFTAQALNLPVRIRGTVSTGDSGTFTTVSIPGFTPYQATLEDWYEWQNDPQELRFTLEYDPSSMADLDLLVSGIDFPDTWSIADNPATDNYTEEAILNAVGQTSGTYQVIVDAFSTPNGPVDYTLRVDTFTTTASGSSRLANEAPVADWFRVNLVSSQALSINVTGGPIVVLMDGTGANVIAADVPQTLGGNASISTSPLAAGEYLVGVSDEGVEYTLAVDIQPVSAQ